MIFEGQIHGSEFTVTHGKSSGEENIFGAATPDGGRGGAINSFFLNLNMHIAGVEFFELKWSARPRVRVNLMSVFMMLSIVITTAIVRVHPAYLTNAALTPAGHQPSEQVSRRGFGHFTSTFAIFYYYGTQPSARKLILILPCHTG